MKRNKDWTDAVRTALRDAEATLPVDGWERLERELGAAGSPAGASGAGRDAEGGFVWRIWRMRLAAAAVVALCIAGGEYLRKVAVSEFEPAAGGTLLSESSASQKHAIPADALRPGVPPDKPAETAAESVFRPGSDSLAAHFPARFVAARTPAAGEPLSAPAGATSSAARSGSAQPEGMGKVSGAASVEQAAISRTDGADASENRITADGEAPASAGMRVNEVDRTARSVHAGAFAAGRMPTDAVSAAAARPRKKASFGLYGAGAVTGSRNGGNGGLHASMSDAGWGMGLGGVWEEPQAARRRYDRCSFRHYQPLSFGLSLRREFAHGLSLESGICYTLLRSDARFWKGGEAFGQQLHFIGIPLRANWQFFERGRFSLYIGAGGMLEKCVAAKFGTTSVDEPGLHWSALGAAGAHYRLGGVVGLYFEPEVAYYFTRTRLRTSRTDEPLTLTLRLGVRLSF